MGVVGFLAGLELRRRRGHLLGLAVLIGLVAGVVLATVAGARRTGTALDRFKDATASADVELAASPPIRVADGQAGVPAVIDAARGVLGETQFSSQGLSVESEGARAATHVAEVTLWILAAVAAAAGLVAVGLVLAREIALMDVNGPMLRTLGVTRTQRVAAAGPVAGALAVAGALFALVVAVAVSPLFPTGVARRADPDLGAHADWLVLGLGSAATVVAVLGVAALAARRSTRPVTAAATGTARRPSRIVAGAAHVGLPPTVTTGLRMAIDRRRGALRGLLQEPRDRRTADVGRLLGTRRRPASSPGCWRVTRPAAPGRSRSGRRRSTSSASTSVTSCACGR